MVFVILKAVLNNFFCATKLMIMYISHDEEAKMTVDLCKIRAYQCCTPTSYLVSLKYNELHQDVKVESHNTYV